MPAKLKINNHDSDFARAIFVILVAALAIYFVGHGFSPTGFAAGWWNNDWSYRRAITLDNSGAAPTTGTFTITSTADFDAGTKSQPVPSEITPDASTVGLWHFNEGSGTTAADASGNGNTGTITGATWTTGKFGNALAFDGVNDYVEVPNSNSLMLTSDFTLSAWIKTGSTGSGGDGNYRVIIGKSSGTAPWPGYEWVINNNGALSMWLSGWSDDSGYSLSDNVWHNVVARLSGTTLQFYVDGVAKGSFTVSPPSSNTNVLRIGEISYTTGRPFNGTIDDVAIYNRALSASEIATLYSGGPDGNYQVEAATDNPAIADGQLELASGKGDAFGLADTDADTWKLDVGAYEGASPFVQDISNGKLNQAFTSYAGMTRKGVILKRITLPPGPFDIQVDFSDLSGFNVHWNAIGLTVTDNSNFVYQDGQGVFEMGVVSSGSPVTMKYQFADWNNVPQVMTTDTSGKLRLVRDASAVHGYYWNGSGWTEVGSGLSTTGWNNAKYIYLILHYGTGGSAPSVKWDNFKLNSGGSINYRTSGNWQSATQTMPSGGKLTGTTVTYSGVSAAKYIDKIEWLVGGVVKATYGTNIVSGTSTTITNDMLTSGTFNDVNADFTVKVYLVGDGTGSPAIEQIDGTYTYLSTGGPQEITPDASTVGLWHFNEGSGTTAADASGSGNTGTISGATWTTSGKFGNALSFDGINDYVSVPDSPSWAFGTNSFTIELWVKWNSLSDIESIMGQSTGGGPVPKWALIKNENTGWTYDNTKMAFEMYDAGGSTFALWSWTASVNTWYHVVVTRSGTSFNLYVNGVQTGGTQTASMTIPDVASDLRIGSDGEAWNYFNGTIDDVRIYNRALSADEVAAEYAKGNVPAPVDRVNEPTEVTLDFAEGQVARCAAPSGEITPDASTVGLWHMNEGSGTTTADASGSGNTGTISGARWVDGKFGKALNFDGVDDWVNPGKVISSSSAITISGWVKFDSLIDYSGILSQWKTGIYDGYALRMTAGPSYKIFFEVATSGGNMNPGVNTGVTGTTALQPDTWYYIVATWSSGDSVKVYVNGVLDGANPNTQSGTLTPTYSGMIGALQWNSDLSSPINFMDGTIDDAAIFNRVLSASEIAAHYAASAPAGTPQEIRIIDPSGTEIPSKITFENYTEDNQWCTQAKVMFFANVPAGQTAEYMAYYGNPAATAPSYPDVFPKPPVAAWPFEEGSGSTTADTSGNNNTGTTTGATWGSGKFGNALSFDGTDDKVTVSDVASLDITGDMTIAAWVKPTDFTGDYKTMVSKYQFLTYHLYNPQFSLVQNTGQLFFFTRNNLDQMNVITSTDSVPAGVWSFVAIVISGTNLIFYKNGVADSGGAQTLANTRTANNGDLTMGYNGAANPQWYKGVLDDVRIYNRALSAGEIAALAGLGPPPLPWTLGPEESPFTTTAITGTKVSTFVFSAANDTVDFSGYNGLPAATYNFEARGFSSSNIQITANGQGILPTQILKEDGTYKVKFAIAFGAGETKSVRVQLGAVAPPAAYSLPIALVQGWNLIGIPYFVSGTAQQLAAKIASDTGVAVEAVAYWDPATQQIVQCDIGAPYGPSCSWSIACGRGYWVWTGGPVTWTVSGLPCGS